MDIGASFVDGGLRGFHLDVGEYYGVPEREVVLIRERRIPDDDIPVVFYLARRAHVAPAMIVDMRLAGRSWMDISFHYGLGPDIFYVPVSRVYGPPYGNAYGYYKSKPRKEWKHIVLSDDDVANLVNLRFISEHYGYAPEKVMKMRSAGKGFGEINDEIRREKREKREGKAPERKEDRGGQGDRKEQRGQGKPEKHKGKGWKED